MYCLPQPQFIQQSQSAHMITAQHIVLSDGLTEGHFFQLCCGCGYQRCCITAGWQSDCKTVLRIMLTHSHISSKTSKFPSRAASCQTVIPALSVTINNLLFISSVVSFSSAHFHTCSSISSFPLYAA